MNSRAKGKRGELEVVERLGRRWPGCKRNLDQFADDKRDILEAGGYHWQVKRTENLRIWAALEQAETERDPDDTPVVVFRRNRSEWYVALRLDDFLEATLP